MPMPVHLLLPTLAVLLAAAPMFHWIGRTFFGPKWNDRRTPALVGALFLCLLVFHAVAWCFRSAVGFNERNIAAPKTETPPELAQIGLTDLDVIRWDGSTSMRPPADRIVSHLTGVPVGEMPFSEVEFWSRHKFSKTHDSIVNVIEGRRDLAFSARKPSEDEWALAGELNVKLVCTPFARDAFIFLVHRNNPVQNLSQQQIRDIYTGRLISWSEVADREIRIAPPEEVDHQDGDSGYTSQRGSTDKILPLVRNRNSGSEELMRERVMRDIPIRAEGAHVVKTMSGIFNALEGNANAVGYSLLYFEKHLAPKSYARILSVDGVMPSRETVSSGAYPYTYECYLIHRESPGIKTERFVHWILQPEGRQAVSESGYVP